MLYLFVACFAGRLQIILPNGHELDPSSSSFNSQSLLEFNKHVLGIGSSANASQKVSGGDLFDRPKALIVVSIVGSDDFNYNGHVFDSNDNFESQQILNDLKLHFGDEMIHADVNSSGIFGSPHFKRNTLEIEPDRDNQDILNMDKLARAIREKDRTSSNVVDYYRIHLDISNARSHDEKMKLEENIKLGIENIEQAINNTENKDVLIELFSHVKPTKEKDRMNNGSFIRRENFRCLDVNGKPLPLEWQFLITVKVLCLEGNLLDAVVCAIGAALADTKLPSIVLKHSEGDESAIEKSQIQADYGTIHKLILEEPLMCCSFGVFVDNDSKKKSEILLMTPDIEATSVCRATCSVVIGKGDQIALVRERGRITSFSLLKKMCQITAERRRKFIEALRTA